MGIDANAVLWSSSERDRVGRPLLVLLHGYGSHEGDLFSLGAYLPLEPVLASLRAPLALGGGANAWWPLRVPLVPDEPRADPEAVEAAAAGVIEWLDALGHPGPVGLLGFSQGAALAVQLLRRAPGRFAFAVALSGFVVPLAEGDDADERLARERPPVFWGRGTLDTVIPEELVRDAAAWFPEHTALDARVYEGVAHGVGQAELADIGTFVRLGFA
ncbi:phospholipase [Rathayibacter sp. AY1E9]|jgi:phospholipase/carboxylesterase|uniref:alpha/beta hydrolase n=1 Tax=unclassified Rathayibacter TaxID=2609250 RepID=UPI000CE8B497|nr:MULTISPECIES: alpha/beta hydrolase-fold protein [unclassified Rathayibacter]PPF15626.1 phospholipase [Rathayibacter sp. AY1A4]PPF71135.1 phospholipase [Rathayibacter sp. AY1E6]PPG36737.1 phospholipase [Rathayibacter sp. AY2B5]PPG52220.1 phospholipase [Rathayibacter sp. AY1E9]PPG57567.1 phospholipase [Rathayibacter sp. AY1C5]